MWNALVSALLLRSSIVMLDGDPAWPDLLEQWRLAEQLQPTVMGVAPPYLMACRKAGLQPGRDCDLSSLRVLCTAGSPLPAEGYRYVYEQLGPELLLINGSGGTDVCTGHRVRAASPSRCTRARSPGRASASTPTRSTPTATRSSDELGELVITKPMPSMPVALWGDADGARYRASYFDRVSRRLAPGRLDPVHRARQLRAHRPLRRDAEPRRRAARAPASSTPWSRTSPRWPTRSWCTSRTPAAAPASCCCSSCRRPAPTSTTRLRERIATALRSELSPRHVPDTIIVGPGDPADADRQEARGAGQADPARRARRAGGQPRLAGRPGGAGRVRRARRRALGAASRWRAAPRHAALRFASPGDRSEREIDERNPLWPRRLQRLGVAACGSRTGALARPGGDTAHRLSRGRRSWPPPTSRSTCCRPSARPADFHGAVTRRAIGDLMLVDCAASPFLGHRGRAVMTPERRARGRPRLPVRLQGRRDWCARATASSR